jgi:hypothetical protein
MLDKNKNAFAAPQVYKDMSIKKCTYAKQCLTSLDLLLSNSPCPQRQALQLQCLGLDEAPEGDYTNDDAKHIDDVIAISGNVASTAAIDADMAVILKGAGEGLGDQITLKVGRWDRGRCARCSSEHVDKLQDKEARERAAKVANTTRDWC